MNTLAHVVAVHADTAHRGTTVQHLSRRRADPTAPNLRQVLLMHQELFNWLQGRGFTVASGALGENVTTTGVDLLGLPRGTLLRLGESAVVEVTGLRNPCPQIEKFQQGLLRELVGYDDAGTVVRRAGIMGVVHHGGSIPPGVKITVIRPDEPHEALKRV